MNKKIILLLCLNSVFLFDNLVASARSKSIDQKKDWDDDDDVKHARASAKEMVQQLNALTLFAGAACGYLEIEKIMSDSKGIDTPKTDFLLNSATTISGFGLAVTSCLYGIEKIIPNTGNTYSSKLSQALQDELQCKMKQYGAALLVGTTLKYMLGSEK